MALITANLNTLYTPLSAVTGAVVSDVFDFQDRLTGRTLTFQWGSGGTLAPSEVDWNVQSSLNGTDFVVVSREVSLQGIKNVQVPGRYIRVQLSSIVGGLSPTVTVMMHS